MTYPDGLLDITAAADWLGVRRSWLRDKVTAREVPFTRIGRHIRFTGDHLAEIVAAGEERPATTTYTRHTRLGRRVAA